MARHIFVVGAAHRDLYDVLVTRFRDDVNVTVVLDPPKADDCTLSTSSSMEAYRRLIADRRLRAAVDEELRSRSHAIVTVPD